MKELAALSLVVAGVLMLRQGALASSWDVLMATGDVCALAIGTYACFVLHARVARRKSWREIGSFGGSPFAYVFALLLASYVLFNWSANRGTGSLQPRARVAVHVRPS